MKPQSTMRLMLSALPVGLGLLWHAADASAQYKCIDSAGKTSYRQLPCPGGTRSVEINQRLTQPLAVMAPTAALTAAPTAAPARSALNPAETEKQAAAQAAQAAQMKENCRRSRERVATMEMGGRISFVDESGQRVVMSDSQIEAELEKARIDVRQWCAS